MTGRHKNGILFIMGVSGCGKTTIGQLLSMELKIPFYDGDDFHSKENVAKMASGTALTDEDRIEWLNTLNILAKKHDEEGAIIVCSALKSAYRDILSKGIESEVRFVYLSGDFNLVMNRMEQRKGHFMPPDLLKSQFETLEPPENAVTVSIDHAPNIIVHKILEKLSEN